MHRSITGAAMLVWLFVGAWPGTVSAQLRCGDLDCSGQVVATDALILLRAAVGDDTAGQCSCTTTTTLTGAATTTTTLRPSGTRPNIIVLLADDLGWGDLRVHGHPTVKTPIIDQLAEDGTLFTQFYVSAPVCSPTRASIMTGRFPSELGVHNVYESGENPDHVQWGMTDWLDPSSPMLPRFLQQRGYATGHFGKWHIGNHDFHRDVAQPEDYGVEDWQVFRYWPDGSNLTRIDHKNRSSGEAVDEGIRFISDNSARPFFLQLWFSDPHAPLRPTDEQLEQYAHLAVPGLGYPTPLQNYYAAVTNMDAQIGRLLEQVDALGLRDHTLILFTSDNGPEVDNLLNTAHCAAGQTGPLRGMKRSLYEGGIRVPFIARLPGGVPAGRIDRESVLATTDLFPTLARLIGESPPPDLDGENAVRALLGHTFRRASPLFWEYRNHVIGPTVHRSPMAAIRVDHWKLLANPDASRIELYDLDTDPSEQMNLSTSHPVLADRLFQRLRGWQSTLPEGPIDPRAGKNDGRQP